MSGGDVVCSGWLKKSPPEKKLRRYVSALYNPILLRCNNNNKPVHSNVPALLPCILFFMCTVESSDRHV